MSGSADRAGPEGVRARLIESGAGRLRLEGDLDFATVRPLLARFKSLLPSSGELEIDLGPVESANSAGLALLLEWLDLARARRIELRYRDLPESLIRIAELSNLRSLLPISDEMSING
jgi:phospholipid transport system transporter-binding protein